MILSSFSSFPCMSLYPQSITPEQGVPYIPFTSLRCIHFLVSCFFVIIIYYEGDYQTCCCFTLWHSWSIVNKRINENPRMLVAFCLEKCSIANCANMLANMLVQMMTNMLVRFAGTFRKRSYTFQTQRPRLYCKIVYIKHCRQLPL